VCTEKERKRERKRGKTERKLILPFFFSNQKLTPVKKNTKNEKMPWNQGDRDGVTSHPGVRIPI
jgi:hypothetical protein